MNRWGKQLARTSRKILWPIVLVLAFIVTNTRRRLINLSVSTYVHPDPNVSCTIHNYIVATVPSGGYGSAYLNWLNAHKSGSLDLASAMACVTDGTTLQYSTTIIKS